MKEVKLSVATVYISDKYKRKHSKAYTGAMYAGVDMDISSSVKRAEDVNKFSMPLGNSDKANEALIKVMVEKIEENGKDVNFSDVWLDDLDDKDYQKLQAACLEVQSESVKKKEEIKK